MKLKKINNDKKSKNYKINISLYSSLNKNEFLVGDKVINKQYNLKGIISKIENDIILVKYSDNTIERFNKKTALSYLDYVDDIQEIVDPMSPQISKNKVKKIINKLSNTNQLFNNTIIEEYDKLQSNKKIIQKEDKINNLINIGISKGLINKDEFELEKTKLLMMDDNDYNEYENNIINYHSESKVTSATDEIEDPNLTEAERALKKIKNGMNTITSIDYSKIPDSSSSRNLESISYDKKNVVLNNYNNDYNQYSFNNSLTDQISNLDWTILSRN